MPFILFALAVFMAPAPAAGSVATECAPMREVTTSEVSVQVFVFTPPNGAALEPLQDATVTISSRGPGTTAKTDRQGYMRFSGLAPGRYDLRVGAPGFVWISQQLRVVQPGSAPSRMIAAALVGGMNCSRSCSVTAPREGLSKAPDCLTPKPQAPRKRL